MKISRELWNKTDSRISYNSSKYTKLKMKVISVCKDYTEFRTCADDEEADYIFKVKRDEGGNLYFNYFHNQSIKMDILFADLNFYFDTIKKKKPQKLKEENKQKKQKKNLAENYLL